MARFERSTFPEHKDTRTVVLRILKIITPVKCVIPSYDGYVCVPEEGRLYMRPKVNTDKRQYQVWSLNIDLNVDKSRMKRALQLLWDV